MLAISGKNTEGVLTVFFNRFDIGYFIQSEIDKLAAGEIIVQLDGGVICYWIIVLCHFETYSCFLNFQIQLDFPGSSQLS